MEKPHKAAHAETVQSLSCRILCNPMNCSLPCPSLSPRACSNSCPLSRWRHPTISSSAATFSSCPQSFPASGSFPMTQFVTSCDQSIGDSASASVLPMTDDWNDSKLISTSNNWFDLLAFEGTLKNLLQHHNSKASILQRSAEKIVVQLLTYPTPKPYGLQHARIHRAFTNSWTLNYGPTLTSIHDY